MADDITKKKTKKKLDFENERNKEVSVQLKYDDITFVFKELQLDILGGCSRQH